MKNNDDPLSFDLVAYWARNRRQADEVGGQSII